MSLSEPKLNECLLSDRNYGLFRIQIYTLSFPIRHPQLSSYFRQQCKPLKALYIYAQFHKTDFLPCPATENLIDPHFLLGRHSGMGFISAA